MQALTNDAECWRRIERDLMSSGMSRRQARQVIQEMKEDEAAALSVPSGNAIHGGLANRASAGE